MEERLEALERKIMSGDRAALLKYVRLQKKLFLAEHRKLIKQERN